MSDDISLSQAERDQGIVRCDACPVLCRIRPGRPGACDRYANEGGKLVRVDPLVLLAKPDLPRVAFVEGSSSWSGELGKGAVVTGIGATTTYPDYKPAPFIVSSKHDGVDMVTVVTEGIFSYCGVKVKIDTDRYLGPEQAAVRVKGEAVGHVTTAEYGSQMLSLGGVHHLTGGSKKEGVVTCEALLALCNREAVELTIDGGSTVQVTAQLQDAAGNNITTVTGGTPSWSSTNGGTFSNIASPAVSLNETALLNAQVAINANFRDNANQRMNAKPRRLLIPPQLEPTKQIKFEATKPGN